MKCLAQEKGFSCEFSDNKNAEEVSVENSEIIVKANKIASRYAGAQVSVSSMADINHGPQNGYLNYFGSPAQAWCAAAPDGNQWF